MAGNADRGADPYAEIEAMVSGMRRDLARAMTVGPCDCPHTPREHLVEGAAVLLGSVSPLLRPIVAAVLLADLCEAAPVSGFDVN